MLRVGIISANWGMIAHLPAWRSIPGIEVVAVCTAHAETAKAAAAANGIPRWFSDFREMVRDKGIDIVDVGTRPDLRHDMVLAALAAGKHVYAGANLAASLSDAGRMRDAASDGPVVALDVTLPFIPAHRHVADLLADGRIGRPVAVSTRFNIALFDEGSPERTNWTWFAKRAHGASALRNLGTHTLHLLVSLLGPVLAVAATDLVALPEWRLPDGTSVLTEVEDTSLVLLRFANGAVGTMQTGWASPAQLGWRMELTGTSGVLVTEDYEAFPSGDTIELAGGRGASGLATIPVPARPERAGPAFLEPPDFPQIRDIAATMFAMVSEVRMGSKGDGFRRAFHVEAVLAAARRAADKRIWVDVSEVEASVG